MKSTSLSIGAIDSPTAVVCFICDQIVSFIIVWPLQENFKTWFKVFLKPVGRSNGETFLRSKLVWPVSVSRGMQSFTSFRWFDNLFSFTPLSAGVYIAFDVLSAYDWLLMTATFQIRGFAHCAAGNHLLCKWACVLFLFWANFFWRNVWTMKQETYTGLKSIRPTAKPVFNLTLIEWHDNAVFVGLFSQLQSCLQHLFILVANFPKYIIFSQHTFSSWQKLRFCLNLKNRSYNHFVF